MNRGGHTARKCRKKAAKEGVKDNRTVKTLAASEVVEAKSEGGSDGYPFYQLHKIGLSKEDPIIVNLSVNQHPLSMELDTGASVTVMSKDIFWTLLVHT